MPRAAPIQVAFNGGQLGPRLQGRIDLAKYQTGCNKLQNFIPTVQGPAIKRSGTRHVQKTKVAAEKSRLIPFEFSNQQSYIIELGQEYMRFYRSEGAVLESTLNISGSPTAASPVEITTGSSHSFSTGDTIFVSGSGMSEINSRFFDITVTGATTFTLDGEDGTGRTTSTGGTVARVYEIADGGSQSIPWQESELFDIQFVQNADVIFFAHPSHAPHKLTRTSDLDWTCEEIDFDEPPFAPENLSATTVYADAATGTSVTVTASAALFDSDMVGGYLKFTEIPAAKHPKWRPNENPESWVDGGSFPTGAQAYYEGNVYEATAFPGTKSTGFDPPVHEEGSEKDKRTTWKFVNKGYGYGKITGVTSSTVATIDVDTDGIELPASAVGSGNATTRWSISAFHDHFGYPAAVAFYEDRLWWGGTTNDPQTFWGSSTSRYEDHEVRVDESDSSVTFVLASSIINAIQWMSGEDVLILGTAGGEFTADAGSADEAITASNIRVRRRSNYGSASIQPRFVDSALLFVRRDSIRMHELLYSFESDRYIAPDLTSLSYDILAESVVDFDYQPSPFRLVWVVLDDGSVASLTYIRDQQVSAWSKHIIGGTDAKIESAAVIPHPDGDQDQVWMLVSRTIDGGTVRHVEFMEKPFAEGQAKEDSFFVDAGLTYDGSATSTITGLHHLEGETVKVLGDGTVLDDKVVSDGQIALARSVEKAQVGLAMPAAQLQTMRFEAGAADGVSQGRRKRIHQLIVRLNETGDGLQYGADFDTMDEWHVRGTEDAMDTPVPLYTGDTPSLDMPGGYEREGRVAVAHNFPLPCTIVAIMPQMTTEQR